MRVLLFACIEKNIGDDLFIYSICRHYPNIDFYIDSSAKYGDLKKIDNLHFSFLLKMWNRVCSIDESKIQKRMIKIFLLIILRLLLGSNNIVVYIVGNAFKNMNYNGERDLNWLDYRLSLSDEFYLISTNFGPYNNQRWIYDCEKRFRKMKDVCFRDKYSFELFKHLENVRYAPDAILDTDITIKNCQEHNLILISMIDCNMKIRGKELNSCCKEYEYKLAKIAEYYITQGYNVVLVTSNYNQDYSSANRIYEMVGNESNLEIFEYNGNFDDVFSLFNKAKYVFATRLHTIILSWLYNVPVIPIIYDIKIKNLLESYMYDNMVLDLLNINQYSIEEIYNNLGNYSFDSSKIINESRNQFLILNEKFESNKI